MNQKKEARLRLQIELSQSTKNQVVDLTNLLAVLSLNMDQLRDLLPDKFTWVRGMDMHQKWNQVVALAGDDLDYIGENFDFLYAQIDNDEVYGDMPLTYGMLYRIVDEMNRNLGYTDEEYSEVLDTIQPFDLPF